MPTIHNKPIPTKVAASLEKAAAKALENAGGNLKSVMGGHDLGKLKTMGEYFDFKQSAVLMSNMDASKDLKALLGSLDKVLVGAKVASAATIEKHSVQFHTIEVPAQGVNLLIGGQTFHIPSSLVANMKNPHNVGADNGPKGSLGWSLGNAHNKIDGQWAVSDAQIDKVKTAARPLLEKTLKAHGHTVTSDAKISIADGFRDSLENLEAERTKAGLPLHADKNYYPVRIESSAGEWESAIHPKDL
jgi:hypothetical protein